MIGTMTSLLDDIRLTEYFLKLANHRSFSD
jgi:hypothetical protein